MKLGLYLVADEIHFRKGLIEDAIVRAIEGGVQVLQLREKHCSDFEFIELARRVLKAVRPYSVPVLINDRIEVARAVGAHGIHIGQSDAPPALAREILGEDAWIGLSIESEEQLAKANAERITYVSASSVFATQTKSNLKRIWGLEGVRLLRSMTELPLVGIGGITEDNLAQVIAAGADGIAIVSSFRAREDWKTKAQRFRERIDHSQLAKAAEKEKQI